MIILSICDNIDILKILRIVKIAITIIKIVVPILLILSCMIDVVKTVSSNDVDINGKLLKNWISKGVAALLVFLIPTFINLLADLGNADTNEISKCINNSTTEKIDSLITEQAQKYLDVVKETLTSSDYSVAQSTISKVKDKTKKEQMLKELEEVKEEIKKKQEESKRRASADNGWWWPVGSKETTSYGGVLFADGTPAATSITAYFAGNDSVHRNLGSGGHGAIDIGAYYDNVIASKSGNVIYPGPNDRIDYPDEAIRAGADGKYNCKGLVGNYVIIDHGDGYQVKYQHLKANTITVRKGDHVEQGQVIGTSGSSGCSTGPHLHFQMWYNGTLVDPLNYVSASNPRP